MLVEQRYRAVLEVLEEGLPVTEVARRYRVARQTVHEWLSRYANGGLAGLADPKKRRRRREDYRRWERGRAMALWQMDVMGRVHLAGGQEVKVVTGIDDHSRSIVCARVVAAARPVCLALAEALRRHGHGNFPRRRRPGGGR
jgi:hypothetical protein